MPGLHLTADLYRCRCDPAWLADARRLGDWCSQAVHGAGLEPLEQSFHDAAVRERGPAGVTGTVLLAHGHVALHTWPARRMATVDVFDGDEAEPSRARALMAALVGRFAPEWTEQRSLDRGDDET